MNHLNRCKTSTCLVAGGRWGTLQSAANEDAAMFLCKRTCFIYIYIHAYIHIYINIYSPAPGRIEDAAGGGHVFYRCCFIWSMSTVIIRLY